MHEIARFLISCINRYHKILMLSLVALFSDLLDFRIKKASQLTNSPLEALIQSMGFRTNKFDMLSRSQFYGLRGTSIGQKRSFCLYAIPNRNALA